MESVAVISGIVELVLSFVLGILVAYTSFRLFARITRDLEEVEELRKNNTAVGVMLGAMLIGSALILRKALFPAISSLQTALYEGMCLQGFLQTAGLSLVYVLLALALAVGGIGFSTRLFLRLTHDIDELSEIKQNNVAVAVTLGCVIIVMSLFLSQGVQSFLSALIPYPAVESIQIMGQP